jgi:mono/diheme cytochrome c family protein
MKWVKKILLGLFVLVVVVVTGFAAFVASRQNLRFDAPEPAIAASTDSAIIARGHYVVRNVAPCATCHGDPKARAGYAAGEDVPLSGGFEFAIPPGSFFVRNITPDKETGIGRLSDGQIARALRYGVGHDGRALLPFMEMQGLSDEDIEAVISYLRVQPAVRNPVPDHRFNLLGKVVKATVLANPVGPKLTPPKRSPRGATVENGRYLAASVATCQSCHTQRNPNTGAFTVPEFSGATDFTDEADLSRIWAPPNLTPDPKTGVLAQMSEDQFVARFRAGRILPGSPMPWQAFSRMDEDDLRAIYRFLKTLPPHEHDTGPRMRPRKA